VAIFDFKSGQKVAKWPEIFAFFTNFPPPRAKIKGRGQKKWPIGQI